MDEMAHWSWGTRMRQVRWNGTIEESISILINKKIEDRDTLLDQKT